MWTLDFETEAIENNVSKFPPAPVGLAVIAPDGDRDYLTDQSQIRNALVSAWNQPKLFHNGKFDVSVAMVAYGLPFPPALTVNDTQYLIFLEDPHAPSLSLKPSAERILGQAPEEANALADWIIRNVPEAKKSNWGAFIARAPVELVRPYALGDVDRTKALYDHLMPKIESKGMGGAYQREQHLLPILHRAEVRGLRVDLPALSLCIDQMDADLRRVDALIHTKFGQTFNLDSPDELASALDAAGMVTDWPLTPGGKRSVAKDALRGAMNNPEMLALLLYRSGLETCLNTFGIKWYNQAVRDGGRLHPNWNQVRQEGQGNSFKGTRTGRLSCDNPNLTNPPGELKALPPEGFNPIPQMRRFLLPEEEHIWVKRDFSSQELRILAHYEDGALMRAYQENPQLDPHKMAGELIKTFAGLDLPRKDVKITAFSTIYGAGVTGLAGQLGCDAAHAKLVREAYMEAIPGIRILSNALRQRGRNGLPLRTWGGRLYLPEAPRLIKGVMRSFEYKLLNYLIQGSAADQTKQTIIDWDQMYGNDGLFLAALHDEINLSIPAEDALNAMAHLQEVMNRARFDVPMLSEGFVGPNFGDLDAVVAQ